MLFPPHGEAKPPKTETCGGRASAQLLSEPLLDLLVTFSGCLKITNKHEASEERRELLPETFTKHQQPYLCLFFFLCPFLLKLHNMVLK